MSKDKKKLHIVRNGTRAQIFDEPGTYGEHYLGDLSEETLRAFRKSCEEGGWPIPDMDSPEGMYSRDKEGSPAAPRYVDRTTGRHVTSTGDPHPRRLSADELTKVANYAGHFLDTLEPDLAARVAAHMSDHDCRDGALALAEVTRRDPEAARLWEEHKRRSTLTMHE